MLPVAHLSDLPVPGQFLHPRSLEPDQAWQWGPVALQDPSQGLLVRLWRARAVDADILLSAPGVAEFVHYTHTHDIDEVSFAFDQNGTPHLAFVDTAGDAWLRWYDPTLPGMTTTALAAGTLNPRLTLDDARTFNIPQSDVILGYAREGLLHYRQQRDRFQTEYTPTQGEEGTYVSANGLRHLSMNSGSRLEFLTDGSGSNDWTVPQVIEELCNRANLPSERIGLQQMDWQRIVRGFMVTNGYGCHGALQALSQVFMFTPYSADGRLHFAPSGRDAVALIPEGDLIDDGQDIERDEDTRRDPIAIPRVLHLNYYDLLAGLNTAKQSSERPEGTRAEDERSVQSAVVMTADEAATCVAIQHGMMVEQQKGELNFRLTSKWLRLTESDAVFLPVGDRVVRGIIVHMMTGDGEQAYKVLRDRQSLYGVQVQGIPQLPPSRPPSSVAGPTLFEFLDIATLRDAHDVLGFRVAVSGTMPAWPGARVDLSLDGGENYLDGQTTVTASVMGVLSSALGAHPHPYPDTHNTCQVDIATPNASLVNTTLAGMMNRRNRAIIGDEIVNFADTDEVTPGTWGLQHWLRGRKGTDAVAHAIGERFVLLDTALFVPAELTWLGRSLTFRAATLGRPVDEATITTVTFTGQSQVERRPSYLQARRDGTDAVITWQGVGRLGGGAHVAMGAYFIGFRVTLTDGSTTETHDTVARALTTSLAAFSGPVTVRVQQNNQLTGLGPYIEVTI